MIQIQHGVGVLAPALVHQPGDIHVLAGNGGGEPTQRIGDVVVQNGNPPLGLALPHVAVGIVDGRTA